MAKDTKTNEQDYIKKQTLLGAVIASLIIGFIAGTVYSSFKLAPQGSSQNQITQNNSPSEQHDNSVQLGGKILQLEQFLKENPDDVQAWTQLGNMFFDSDQYANAIEAYTRSLALQPDNTSVLTDLGVMYRRNKQPEKAIESFDKAIQVDPGFETARFNKGVVLLHDLEDFEGGINAWEDLIRQNPMAMAPNGESVDAIVRRMKSQASK